MPKKCDTCSQDFKGFGTTCSSCRKAGNNTGWDHCQICSAHFKGTGICPDCKAPCQAAPMGTKPDVEITRKVAGKCAECGKDIGYGESMTSAGLEYHMECFKCHKCGGRIEGPHTVDSDGKTKTCKSCLGSQVCECCRLPLGSGKTTAFYGHRYHPECLACDSCGQQLSSNFCRWENYVLCKKCVDTDTPEKCMAEKHSGTDYYKVIGVDPTANKTAIAKAYQKLALQHHPDKNPGNRELAELTFKQLTAAFRVLSDDSKRRVYDSAQGSPPKEPCQTTLGSAQLGGGELGSKGVAVKSFSPTRESPRPSADSTSASSGGGTPPSTSGVDLASPVREGSLAVDSPSCGGRLEDLLDAKLATPASTVAAFQADSQDAAGKNGSPTQGSLRSSVESAVASSRGGLGSKLGSTPAARPRKLSDAAVKNVSPRPQVDSTSGLGAASRLGSTPAARPRKLSDAAVKNVSPRPRVDSTSALGGGSKLGPTLAARPRKVSDAAAKRVPSTQGSPRPPADSTSASSGGGLGSKLGSKPAARARKLSDAGVKTASSTPGSSRPPAGSTKASGGGGLVAKLGSTKPAARPRKQSDAVVKSASPSQGPSEASASPRPSKDVAAKKASPNNRSSTSKEGAICAACGKCINQSVVQALGKTFHRKCFNCLKCKAPLGSTFFPSGEGALCQKCNDEDSMKDAPQCSRCRQRFVGDFKQLPGGKVICSKCSLGVCAGCNKKIEGSFLQHENLKFHSECFNCEGCGTSLVDQGAFMGEKGQRFCKGCAEGAK